MKTTVKKFRQLISSQFCAIKTTAKRSEDSSSRNLLERHPEAQVPSTSSRLFLYFSQPAYSSDNYILSPHVLNRIPHLQDVLEVCVKAQTSPRECGCNINTFQGGLPIPLTAL